MNVFIENFLALKHISYICASKINIMEIIGIIIIVGIVLLFGYGMLLEYLSNKDIRPVYHIFIIIFAIMILFAICS